MALETLEQITPDWRTSIDKSKQLNNSIETLRAALAQPEPEPVAYLNVDEDGDVKSMEWGPDMLPGVHALYAAPPRREWLGLTDDEIAEAISAEPDDIYLADFRKVEAKLRDKNA